MDFTSLTFVGRSRGGGSILKCVFFLVELISGQALKMDMSVVQYFEATVEGGPLAGHTPCWKESRFSPECAISHHQQGRIDFNTVNPSLSTGKDFLIHSL